MQLMHKHSTKIGKSGLLAGTNLMIDLAICSAIRPCGKIHFQPLDRWLMNNMISVTTQAIPLHFGPQN